MSVGLNSAIYQTAKAAASLFAVLRRNLMTAGLNSNRPKPKSWMVLRGAQGDRPTEGREAPGAKDAQPSQGQGRWKAQRACPE